MRFRVVEPVSLGGVRHEPGEVVELDSAEGALADCLEAAGGKSFDTPEEFVDAIGDGGEVEDDFDVMDKDTLKAFARANELDVNLRLGEVKLRAAIRKAFG